MSLGRLTQEVIDDAVGRRPRRDPVLGASGGPAGNARLTAWTGLVLLCLGVAELITVLDLSRFIDWHVALGVAMIPPALFKTATTGWRIARYYLGNPAYRRAGPPPMLLRLLGPLVVLSTLALLASGLLLVLLGPAAGRQSLVPVLGKPLSLVTVHAALAVAWSATTGLHVLARLVPALTLAAGGRHRTTRVPGRRRRVTTLGVMLVSTGAAAVLALPTIGGWAVAVHRHHDGPDHGIVRHDG